MLNKKKRSAKAKCPFHRSSFHHEDCAEEIEPSMDTRLRLKNAPYFYQQWKILKNPAAFLDLLIDEFGDFVRYRGLVEFYLINDPTLVKKILNETHRNFDKNTVVYDRFRKVHGQGLVTAEGDHWRHQRKLIQPAFTPTSIERFFEVMVDSSARLSNRWEACCDKEDIINIADEMGVLTLEIVGKSLFSNSFNDHANDIRRWARTINEYSAQLPIPIMGSMKLPTPLNLRLEGVLNEYHDFMKKLIRERCNSTPTDDLLNMFLNTKDEETRLPMDEHAIAEESIGMIIGGHETVAAALTWIFYELKHHPEVEGRLREEIQQVIQTDSIKFSDLPKLKYLKMVIQEVMRLHPPFWFENRNAIKDVEMGGVTIPKGSMIILSRYALHRNDSVWSDPDYFDPERFNPDNISGAPVGYIPFGGGPRVCIGKHFSMMEISVIVCSILQKFDIEMVTPCNHDIALNMTMELEKGFPVRLKRKL